MSVTGREEERILGIIETARKKRGKFRDERVNMAHGAGGKATQSMIEALFEPAFGAQTTEDAATVEIGGARLAFTTDSFVVKPLRFPGESVDSPEERGESLPGAGWSADQGVRARGDRGPAPCLRRRGFLERGLKPPPHRLGEGLQG